MKSTCVDALAHMIESRLNTNANAFSRAYAEEGMKLWASCKGCLETEKRFAQMTDDEFSTFMQASVLAGHGDSLHRHKHTSRSELYFDL